MVEYRSPKPLVRVRILVPLLKHLRDFRCFFHIIGNYGGYPITLKDTNMLVIHTRAKRNREVSDYESFYNILTI